MPYPPANLSIQGRPLSRRRFIQGAGGLLTPVIASLILPASAGLILPRKSLAWPFPGPGRAPYFILDSFTDSDGTTLEAHKANWVKMNSDPSAEIHGNRGRVADIDQEPRYAWNQSLGPDCEVFARFPVSGSSTGFLNRSLLLRYTTTVQATADGYMFKTFSGADMRIRRADNGTETTLDSDTIAVSNGDKLTLRAVGSTITGLQNGVEVLSATDATYGDGGFPGLAIGGDTDTVTMTEVDNFGARTL